jgi:phosphoenolpyruvate carboxykinase (ATP)
LSGRAIRHRQTHQHQAYARLVECGAQWPLLDEEYVCDPVFGFEVPQHCPEVLDSVLDPASSWPSREEHMTKYQELANRFIENYKKFASPQYAEMYEQIRRAGPRI